MGRSQPSTRVLRVIAHRLGASIDYLVDGGRPALELELAVERARILLARGGAAQALRLAEPAAREPWPLGSDARLCQAAAHLALGRRADARALLDVEETELRRQGDGGRLERLRALRMGQPLPAEAAWHERHGDRAVRDGRPELALDHYRSARALREAGPTGAGPTAS